MGKKRTSPTILQESEQSAVSRQIEDYTKFRNRIMKGWYLLYFILPTIFLAIVLTK
ncbi:MAG: hypothetical protein V1915_01680 [Candidatus Bathyarchaeota archaeon]